MDSERPGERALVLDLGRRQVRVGFTGVWRGGVSLVGVALAGVGFIGGRAAAMVL